MKTDLKPLNEKGRRHGLWTRYHTDGHIFYCGMYVNGKRDGIFERYLFSGELIEKTYYIW